jgi:hypothetical protein
MIEVVPYHGVSWRSQRCHRGLEQHGQQSSYATAESWATELWRAIAALIGRAADTSLFEGRALRCNPPGCPDGDVRACYRVSLSGGQEAFF